MAMQLPVVLPLVGKKWSFTSFDVISSVVVSSTSKSISHSLQDYVMPKFADQIRNYFP